MTECGYRAITAAVESGLARRVAELRASEALVEGGFLDLEANPEADRDEDRGGEEAGSPPPADETLLGEGGGEQRQHRGGEHVAARTADLRPRRPKAAPLPGKTLRDEDQRATDLTADGEPLHEAHRHQQGGRGHADGGEVRDEADRARRGAHDHETRDQRALASVAVTDPPEHHTARWAADEAHRVGHEGEQDRGRARVIREERVVEDQRGARGEEEEVVPLDHGSDGAGEEEPSGRAIVHGAPRPGHGGRHRRAAGRPKTMRRDPCAAG